MGCNCKQIKKIEKNIPSVFHNEYKKQGLKKFLNIIKDLSWKLLGFTITFIFTMIAIPVIAFMALYNFTKHGEMVISLPFLKNHHKVSVGEVDN